MKHLRQTTRDWDLIDLRYVDAEGADRGRTGKAMRAAGFRTLCRRWRCTPTVEMHAAWDDFWALLPESRRQRYLSAEKVMSRQGNVSLQRWRPEGTMTGDTDRHWDLFDACVGMLRLNEGSALRNAQGFALLRDTHAAAVDAGSVDLSLLCVDHRPMAWAYSFHRTGCVEVVQIAVEPVLAEEAATVLLGRMLRDSFERGDRTVLFSPACAHLGQDWQNLLRSSYRYTHFSLSRPRSQALHLNHCLKRWLNLDPTIACPSRKPSRITVAKKPTVPTSDDPVLLSNSREISYP
jgi:hypothetical protein